MFYNNISFKPVFVLKNTNFEQFFHSKGLNPRHCYMASQLCP